MMLGVNNPDTGKIELYALITLIVILVMNIVSELFLLLPAIPTKEQLYGIVIKSLFTAGVIYLANKGIKWRKQE